MAVVVEEAVVAVVEVVVVLKCLKCGYEWTPRITVRKPRRCPECGQAKWWEPRRDGKVFGGQELTRPVESRPVVPQRPVPLPRKPVIAPDEEIPDWTGPSAGGAELDRLVAGGQLQKGVEMCEYTEFNRDDGETYRCRLAKHPRKVPHQPGEKVS